MRPASNCAGRTPAINLAIGPMLNLLRLNMTADTGATAIEYALVAGMIAMVIITAVGLVGSELQMFFTQLGNLL